MQAVILANGEFPKSKKCLDILQNAPFLIACDGAVQSLHALQFKPSVVIGDLDSIDSHLKALYNPICVSEQNSNDLSKAFFYALNKGFDDFIFLGLNGKREDHALANTFLLLEYFKFCQKIQSISDYGLFRVLETPFILPSFKGEQISLFSLNLKAQFTSKNLKYPLKNLRLKTLFSGSLNEATDSFFILSSTPKSVVLVYQKFL
ncbi:thiamine diphosphokinase [Helicobacter pylori]|uniref:Thiamine diphosphokinase n=1 Tax=Helicobacter pylori NY40 TaxID=1426844 RepID=A0A060PRU1_HELPX|nr:thiamine diphosphokinase [Helicobacter pylori]NHA47406.1 thiamine diphosphokinase [Helicobacter pylori]RKV33947.1 thiamine diphosphokinase [Helicobacter pylori]RKV45071.1 thiamine diphosphokinase [Helicobacter pylori]WQV87465.1 thiamine diphosphokinase [Helicobacter pylori]WQX73740.1 thiamine diphosphokinase [Helicobacter pylori]